MGAFQGFGQQAFNFFDELYFTQERAWFQDHKPIYEAAAKKPMLDLLADLTEAFAQRKLGLIADPRRAIFRIHRDIRFAKDKRPYKTHIGAVMTPDGGKDTPGLVYIHIDPVGCFAAAGFYHLSDAALALVRTRVTAKPEAYRTMLATLAKNGLALSADDDALKRRPRGFEAVTDPDLVEALCRKSFIVRLPLSREDVAGPGLIGQIAQFAEHANPLLTFGWQSLGYPIAKK